MKRAKPLCEATAQAWFKKLGWAMWEKKKGTYVDGHERYAQRCDRFMDAYRIELEPNGKGLTPLQVQRAVKQYKSHRCIPRDLTTLFPEILNT